MPNIWFVLQFSCSWSTGIFVIHFHVFAEFSQLPVDFYILPFSYFRGFQKIIIHLASFEMIICQAMYLWQFTSQSIFCGHVVFSCIEHYTEKQETHYFLQKSKSFWKTCYVSGQARDRPDDSYNECWGTFTCVLEKKEKHST